MLDRFVELVGEQLQASTNAVDGRHGLGAVAAYAHVCLVALGDCHDLDVGPRFTMSTDVKSGVLVSAA